MKTFVITLVAFIAYAAAGPTSSSPHIDIYRNILEASSGRVVGGENAKRHQFPHQASLLWSNGGFPSHICGGTLINKRWVLTAGHCKTYDYGEYQIKLGQLQQGENHADVQVFKVVEFIVHSEYPGGAVVAANDIAVIELDRDAEITEAVQIAKLATVEECNSLENSVLSGWGRTGPWSSLPVNLQWQTFPRISNKQCGDDLTALLGSPELLDDSMICITPNPGQKQSSCNGDSGGPLILERNGALTGVVSWAILPCGTNGAPSMFTRVCSHYDFINEHVKSSSSSHHGIGLMTCSILAIFGILSSGILS